ncbi:unnamed protein product [Leuciscus chuanchicus]
MQVFNLFTLMVFLVSDSDVSGVGADEVSVSVMEGDSVTLNTGVQTNQQEDIKWYFNDTRIAQITGDLNFICTDVQCNEDTERFRDRLKLDHQTGSLTITNITTTDSGEYELKIINNSTISEKTFNITVLDSGLSSGAVGGICVAGVVVLLLVAAGVIHYQKRQANRNVTRAVCKPKHLSQLGLWVNREKSKLSPVQRISFLSMELDSVNQTARLIEERARIRSHSNAAQIASYEVASALASWLSSKMGMAARDTPSDNHPGLLPNLQPLVGPYVSTGRSSPRTSVQAYYCLNRYLHHRLLAVRLALGRLKSALQGKHVLVRTDRVVCAPVAYCNSPFLSSYGVRSI